MLNPPGGSLILTCGSRRGVTRIRRWLPRSVKLYYLDTPTMRVTLHWLPHHGVWPVAYTPLTGAECGTVYHNPRPKGSSMIRRQVAVTPGTVPLGVGAASVVLAKFPKLREHMSCRAYDDGSIREPGYIWVKTSLTAWVITIFDPDAGARLPVQAATLDECLALAERLLSADDAPWEIDDYLRDRMAKKKKRKGA